MSQDLRVKLKKGPKSAYGKKKKAGKEIHVIISKFEAPLLKQNGFCGEVNLLFQVTKVPVSPKMSLISLDLT